MIPLPVIETIYEVPFDSKPGYFQREIAERRITHFIVRDEDGSYGVLPTDAILGRPLSRLFADLAPDKYCEVIPQERMPLPKLYDKHYILKGEKGELRGLIPRLVTSDHQQKMAFEVKEHYSLYLKTFTHELLNICNGILGLAELAETSREDGRLLLDRDILETVRANLSEFIALNLKPGNLTLGRVTRTDINALLKEAVLITRGEALCKNIRLETVVHGPQPQVVLAKVLVLQALINLILNAIRYSPPGSSVYIAAEELPGEPRFLRLVVSDSGIGILPQEINSIFEKDFRGSNHQEKKGLGMGLHIVKAIVQQLNGKIGVNSPPVLLKTGSGSGTEFWMEIPVS